MVIFNKLQKIITSINIRKLLILLRFVAVIIPVLTMIKTLPTSTVT